MIFASLQGPFAALARPMSQLMSRVLAGAHNPVAAEEDEGDHFGHSESHEEWAIRQRAIESREIQQRGFGRAVTMRA
jgi:hypothetical protein